MLGYECDSFDLHFGMFIRATRFCMELPANEDKKEIDIRAINLRKLELRLKFLSI